MEIIQLLYSFLAFFGLNFDPLGSKSYTVLEDGTGGIMPNYDYYQFGEILPGSSCKVYNCTDTIIHDLGVNIWKIHGLWAQTNGREGPMWCRPGVTFNQTAIPAELERKMEVSWPSSYISNAWFWSHEWIKHGSCAKNLGNIEGPLKQNEFFSAVLKIHYGRKTSHVLELAGIVPSEEKFYSTEQISKVLKADFSKNPYLYCNLAADGKTYLSQIGYCFDLNLKPQECYRPDPDSPIKGCSDSAKIYMGVLPQVSHYHPEEHH